jgi:8-oxo-dGTP pyrophosphatase MutT (NUDIX family)
MLDEIIKKYVVRFPDDQDSLQVLQKQVSMDEKLNAPANYAGHVTGAAVVLSPDRTKILLVHHGVLQRWLQPGGHWEPDEDTPLQAAQREAEEEAGVSIAHYLPIDADNPLVPIEISVHLIPERPARSQPAHYHHDFRYVFVAANEDLNRQVEEVNDVGWFAFDAPEAAEMKVALERVREFILPTTS